MTRADWGMLLGMSLFLIGFVLFFCSTATAIFLLMTSQ